MSTILIVLLICLGIAAAVVLWAIGAYNKLVGQKNRVEEAWSDIEVQQKRRYNLIPNLVETVKGYAAHEQGTLEKVIAARNAAMADHGSAEHQAETDNILTGALRQLFALSEAYPDLKANESFQNLQKELADAEDLIQKARRYFNGNVRDMNNLVEQFPSNIIAGMFNFEKGTFYEVDDPEERAVPDVKFN